MTEINSTEAKPSMEDSSTATVDRSSLRRASVRGVAISFSSQMVKFVVQFGYQIAIMRLLAPQDFGLVAMAAPLLSFVQLFTDFGLSQAVIQRETITQKQLSFLYWFTAVVSGGLSLLTIALAPLAALFYHEPRVTLVVMALGGLLFVSGLQTQHNALLNRRMEFGKLAAANLTSMLVGLSAGIVSALMGCGYWSLVINQAAGSLTGLVMLMIFTRWQPDRPERVADVKGLIGYGGNITGFNMVNFFARNLDNVLIGRVWGEATLGLYDRAYKLLLLPLSQVVWPFSSVALPALSRTLKEPDAYRRAFLRMMEFILLATWPGIIFAAITSNQLILTVLGNQWGGVAPIFSILAISGLYSPIGNACGWLFTSQDRTREFRNWGFVSSAIFVTSFLVGLPWGAVGVATSYVAFGLFQGPLNWWVATRHGPVSLRNLLKSLLPFGVSGVATAGTVAGLQYVLTAGPIALVVLFLAAHIVFMAIMACFPQGRGLFTDLIAQLHHLRHRRA